MVMTEVLESIGAGEGNRTIVFSLEVRYRTYTAPSLNFT
jgi:hypothetical protein